jgi:ADP-ribose pyrophosphatase
MDLKLLERNVLYRGKIIDLIVDTIEYPSGKPGIREVARHPGGAATVAMLKDNRLLLVRQLRYPFGESFLELPAGKLSPGEDPSVCAARELTEETGWLADKLEPLTSIVTTPGFCDEVIHIYLATGLRESAAGHRREEGEFSMLVEIVPFQRAVSMVESGEIRDAKTMIGILLGNNMMQRRRV